MQEISGEEADYPSKGTHESSMMIMKFSDQALMINSLGRGPLQRGFSQWPWRVGARTFESTVPKREIPSEIDCNYTRSQKLFTFCGTKNEVLLCKLLKFTKEYLIFCL